MSNFGRPLVRQGDGSVDIFRTLGLEQYIQAARGLGYTPVALLRMGHWDLSNFCDTVGMLPGHKATFLQEFPGLQTLIIENDRMYEQRAQAAASAQAQANAVLQANGACPLGGAHEWATNSACGIGIRVCRKCYANA
jgi:hypothetical protein